MTPSTHNSLFLNRSLFATAATIFNSLQSHTITAQAFHRAIVWSICCIIIITTATSSSQVEKKLYPVLIFIFQRLIWSVLLKQSPQLAAAASLDLHIFDCQRMRKHCKGSKEQQQQQHPLIEPSTLMHAESGTGGGSTVPPGTVISPSISPSSPESEGQSGSLTGMTGTGGTATATGTTTTSGSYLSDEPIPPPSPFDQPSTSQGFPVVKVIFYFLVDNCLLLKIFLF